MPPVASTASNMNGRGDLPIYDEAARIKMEAFRKVKPTCVALMELAQVPPTPTTPHVTILTTLHRLVSPLPSTTFTPGMINYLILPVTHILRSSDPLNLPDNFLETAFRYLVVLVTAWKKLPEGIDLNGWEQLWRFVVNSVLPRVSDGTGKGKGKELGQETIYEAVNLLQALLVSDGEEDKYPTKEMRAKWSSTTSPLMPTLFQSITLLLSTIPPKPSHLPLQKASLSLLNSTISFLKGQHPVLASVLPGVTSKITRLFADEGRTVKGDVAGLAATLVQDVVVWTLNDSDLRELGVLRPEVTNLADLADVDPSSPLPSTSPIPPSPAPSNASTSRKVNPFPPLSVSYLSFTSTQLLNAIPPIIASLLDHNSHTARLAAVSLAASILQQCSESLGGLIPHHLRILLQLSKDSFDQVRHEAARQLRLTLQSRDLTSELVELLNNGINSLPRLIVSQQDNKVIAAATLITAICDIAVLSPGKNSISELLGPNGKVERWSWSLLECLEFGRPNGWSAPPNASKTAELGWTTSFASGVVPLLENGDIDQPMREGFPVLPLRYVESPSTSKSLASMLVAMGTAGGDKALHSVDYFLNFAKNQRSGSVSKAVSALWVAEQLLDGVSNGQLNGLEGKIDRKTSKMAKQAVRIALSLDDLEDEDNDYEIPSESKESSELIPVEREKGINALTTILDRPIANGSAATETRRLHVQAQRVLLTCNSLRILALSSQILSSSFRPLLLNVLYTVLSHLASPQPLIREHAEIALASIAYNTNYASPSNMILDNVDYIVNVVSLRLTRAKLSPQAPLVLVAMIRLVGGEIVPMVHDVVEEIFDALDDYHGYEALTAGLLAVLSVLVEVMKGEVEAEGLSPERLKKQAEMRRIDLPPDPERDFQKFKLWMQERTSNRQREMDEILERAPQHAWGKEKTKDDEEEIQDQENGQPIEEDEIPPTRTQSVCIQILEKSMFFLTHQSPFLRSRILMLIRDAIPVLAAGNREGDLLPLIDRGWNSILSRLDDSVSYVVEAAAEVLESLAEHVGDFMSKRILDHAWPRFKRLLSEQKIKDSNSALSRRFEGIGTEGKFTSSHRFHVAVLKCIRWVVEEVPINEDLLWEMMLSFRVFLDKRTHQELQDLAMVLYKAFAIRDGDALWVALKATMGTLEGDGVWRYLMDENLDISHNAEKLLEVL